MKKLLVSLALLLLVASEASAALTLARQRLESAGSETKVEYLVTFDSSYASGGESLTAAQIGLSTIHRVVGQTKDGYAFEYDYSTKKLKAYNLGVSAFTPAGSLSSTSGGSPAGTNNATIVNVAAPVKTGTGITAVGNVLTTTDLGTATLNQYAGMWIRTATGTNPLGLILSNTAVNNAANVFTIQGATTTDAGAYSIYQNTASVFSGSALAGHVHTLTGTPVVATSATEVVASTNLSAIVAVIDVYGN